MKRIILLILALSSTRVGVAQEPLRTLTFDEALKQTLEYNPDIDALRYELNAATFERKAAIGLRMPKIGIAGSYTHLGDNIEINYNDFKPNAKGVFDELAPILPPEVIDQASKMFASDWGGLRLQDSDFGFVGATATLPIYMGGEINAANRVARINQESVVERGNQKQNSLVSELVERYYGLVLANQVVRVRREVVDGVALHLYDAIELEKNGIIAKGERLFVEVKMAEAERDLRSAVLEAKTIHSAMCNTMNDSENFQPISRMFIVDNIAQLSHFQDLAIRNNPLLNQVALKRRLAIEGLKVQRSNYLPDIVAMGGYNFYEYQVNKMVPKWAVGVGVKLNIFDGFNREFKYKSAKQRVKQVGAIEQSAQNNILILIDKLYNNLLTYRDQMPSIESSMIFAKEYLRIKREAFKEGIVPSSDVVDAELGLAKIRVERARTVYMYDVTLAKLLEASGISDEFIIYANSQSTQNIKFE